MRETVGYNDLKMMIYPTKRCMDSRVGDSRILYTCFERRTDGYTCDYYIATITESECPDNLCELELSAHTWAVFEIVGPMPTAMAEVWGFRL